MISVIFGETIVLQQENGPDVHLQVRGDEFYAVHKTLDGYTVVYDIDLGLYCYANVLDGRLVSTRTPITKSPPLEIPRHLRESESVRKAKFEHRFAQLRPRDTVTDSNIHRVFGPADGLLTGRRLSEGHVLGLTVLVEFQDVDATVEADDIHNMLDSANFTLNGNVSSVREYFRLVSNGRFDYENRVVGPIKLSQNKRFYETTLFVEEALNLVSNSLGVNLADFDSRGEGIIDAINFMYAGRTVYGIGGDNNNPSELWPHSSTINLTFGSVRTNFYQLSSMGRQRVDLSIGTFCHESGHLLCRFPDMYDYGNRDGDSVDSRGIGSYCLMGSGNHLNEGRTPAPVCAYLRDLVGWTTNRIFLLGSGIHTVRHSDYGTVVKYETDRLNEYFLVENRTSKGLDAHLPSSGLAVYHCDRLGSNELQQGTSTRHYQCALLQADGRHDLENNQPADTSDLFGKTRGWHCLTRQCLHRESGAARIPA